MSYEIHSSGKFKARALGGELREGKKAPYVSVEYQTAEGRVWKNFSLSETELKSGKTVADYSIEGLMLSGWDGKDLGELAGLGSREVELVIEHEKDDSGEWRANVRYVNDLNRSSGKKADSSKAKEINRLMRGRVVVARQDLGIQEAPPAAKRTPAHSPADDPDGMPF